MNQILQGQPMTVFGDGDPDAGLHATSMTSPRSSPRRVDVPAARNQVFNIGADQAYSVNDLAHAVARAMGTRPALRAPRGRATRCRHAYSRTTRSGRSSGRHPR